MFLDVVSKPQVQQAIAYGATQAAHSHQQNKAYRAVAAEARIAARSFSLAVLGESEAGKTTLINSWRGVQPGEVPGHTQAPVKHGDVVKKTASGDVLIFNEVVDVGGHINNLPLWDDLMEQGRWILYLVNADRLRTPAPRHMRDPFRLEDDADRILKIIQEREKGTDPPHVGIVVVVTHTDQDPRWSDDPAMVSRYEQNVREQLDRVILRLGGDRRVRLVSGSLADQAGADRLTDRITEHLLRWAP
jgi:GTPase SAR1 family protein